MSNLKDTDIDDLFRRASEKYPLRTDSSDWDRMAAALEKDPPEPDDGTDNTQERRKRRFFWLFLLFPLGVGGLGYYAWHSGTRTQAATTAKTAVGTNTTAAGSSPAANTPGAANTTNAANNADAANTPSTTETRSANPSTATGTPTPDRIAPATKTGGSSAIAAAPTTVAASRDDRSLLATSGRQAGADLQGIADRQGNADRQRNARQAAKAGHRSVAGGDFTVTGAGNGGSGNGSFSNGNRFSASLTQHRQDRLFYDLLREPVDRNYQLNVNVVAPAVKKDSGAVKQKTTPKTKTSYLYAGILGAPDLSTVRMQAVKEVGNTFGVLVGYGFSPHWAVETGVYLDRKKYYTEGQYFNKGEISRWLSPSDTLNDVNGTCNMWEIPLNVRYTLNPASKTRWFATAGFTTYLMTKENYTYNYQWNGWNGNINKTTKKNSPYPFSIIGLSAGFEQKLGKVGNLRVEPYLRIPLTGMGVGKLPIMSTGINIGITRQLWKK